MSSSESDSDEAAYGDEHIDIEIDEGDDSESTRGVNIAIKTRKPKNRSRKSVQAHNPPQSLMKTQNLPNVTRAARPAHVLINSLPSRDHRHRPGGIWYPPCNVVRLSRRPVPFTPVDVVPTTSITEPRIERRTKKAWMYCVSPGPCWELLEDRTFFKEEYADDSGKFRISRPHVYPCLSLSKESIVMLDAVQGQQYMPEGDMIDCLLGLRGAQTLHKFAALSSIAMDSITEGDSAHILYAGDPVTSVDWCPFTSDALRARKSQQILAVCTRKAHSRPILGTHYNSPANIQVWSFEQSLSSAGSHVKCLTVICIDEGKRRTLTMVELLNNNQGTATTKILGILSAVTMDGNVHIYAIPDVGGGVDIPRVKIQPMINLSLPRTTCQALDWANSQTIAIGGENATMTHYFPVHQTSILSIAWVRAPVGKPNGQYKLTEDPTIICSTGAEGKTNMTDTRDCIPRLVARNREVPHACIYSTFCGAIIATDVDFWIKLYQMVPSMLGKGHSTTEIGGVALTLSCSDMHPLLAVGCADGACITTNLLRGTRREGAVPLLNHKLFQLDYNPTSKQYRILDHFLPRESGVAEGTVFKESSQPKAGSGEAAKKDVIKEGFESGRIEPSGLWAPNIAVSTVAWNSVNGLGNASLLASGTTSGLVRIDEPEGAWMRGTRPYGSMAEIRFEGAEFANESGSESD
ncbi:hypothetical protein PIIN_01328 [Serendipita indica DSM 11827]|uniref:Uncharacterized protein n=1 Tax=Serendipita indica (strain DSM 11827) TaxID=1109443 RepID=G4T884_SERID|nr:hypothetical protein PIIN_01328 [Serendipita indica DSM 11827]